MPKPGAQKAAHIAPPMSLFEEELSKLLNKYSMDSLTETPDFMLAHHVLGYITELAMFIKHRERWHGRQG